MKLTFTGLIFVFLAVAPARAETVSPLHARGYTVMPQPQVVKLDASDFEFGAGWKIEVQGAASHDIAIETLKDELERRYQLKLGGSGANMVRLILAPNSVAVGAAQDADKQALAEQAYKIDLSRGRVTIAANAPAGLFYGVVTLVQLLKPSNGALLLPEGHIEDWPDLQTRQIYWDDAHHLDRMETAMTPAELQELTDYGLRYHVQLIPYLDGPGHIAFILKHPEYAKLREYPESNYELCATNPDSYKLMFGMFQDLIDANKGVKYFYLSTDEPYYVGMADNAQCQEGRRAKELGSVGKMLGEFTTKTANYLHDRGRTVVFWGEYPMKPEDLASLPSHLVNGEVYGPQFDPLFKKQGIREMIYTSSEGEEKLFPDYFPLPAEKRVHTGRGASRRITDTFQKITFDTARRDANLIGSINAGWADMGLHPETFWLGYATSAATGWHPGSPDPAELMATFYPLFYGHRVANMNRVYELMSTQAQFWSDSWDQVNATALKPIWGNSYRIFDPPQPRHDQTFPLPPAPAADLTIGHDWAKDNAKRFQLAAEFMRENDELLGLLHANLARANVNRYNLEVFLAIAHLYRQNLEMLQTIHQMNGVLQGAEAARITQPKAAVGSVDRALELASTIRYARNVALADAIATWYKAWFPRLAEANGRRYLHELDDVKDHLPDRTVDMTYLIYRQLLLPFGDWVDQVRAARNQYAQMHNLPVRNDPFDWNDLKPVYVPPAPEEDTE